MAISTLKIDKNGLYYNEEKRAQKIIVLDTDLEAHSRGMTLKITNMDYWIDVQAECLKNNIRIYSITHDGKKEPWFIKNNREHNHDKYGEQLNVVDRWNILMVERGVKNIIIDTTDYNSDYVFEFEIM